MLSFITYLGEGINYIQGYVAFPFSLYLYVSRWDRFLSLNLPKNALFPCNVMILRDRYFSDASSMYSQSSWSELMFLNTHSQGLKTAQLIASLFLNVLLNQYLPNKYSRSRNITARRSYLLEELDHILNPVVYK